MPAPISGGWSWWWLIILWGLFGLLIVVGWITAFYGLRLMWTIFGRNTHGAEGKRLREIPDLMRFSFIAMLAVTMLIDFSVPLLIPAFNHFFFPIVHTRFLGDVFEVGWYILPSISTVMTLAALALGTYLAYQVYMTRKANPDHLMVKHRILEWSHLALSNRLYIDAFYRMVADSTIALSRIALVRLERGIGSLNGMIGDLVLYIARTSYKHIEIEGVSRLAIRGFNDLFEMASQQMLAASQWAYPRIELKGFEAFNEHLTKGVIRLTEKVRAVHTGILSYNILGVLVSIIVMVILLLIHGGRFEVLT